MKLLALLLLLAAACGSSSSPPSDGAVSYPTCPQHRVEGIECMSSSSDAGVLSKAGRFCAACTGVDDTGQPTAKPVGCVTVAGGDLCVADCGECS